MMNLVMMIMSTDVDDDDDNDADGGGDGNNSDDDDDDDDDDDKLPGLLPLLLEKDERIPSFCLLKLSTKSSNNNYNSSSIMTRCHL